MLAVALSAKLTGKLAYIFGDGLCAGGSPYCTSVEGLYGIDLTG
jgi:hypothetical protein